MRYSVYNYGTKLYDYYDDGKPSPTHAGAPSVVALSGVGATPEGAAWRVPPGAKKIGRGELPQGRVASMGDLESDLPILGAVALAIYLAVKVIR